jgi:hypothetical protein
MSQRRHGNFACNVGLPQASDESQVAFFALLATHNSALIAQLLFLEGFMIRKTIKTALIVFLTLFSFTVFVFAGTIQLPKTG